LVESASTTLGNLEVVSMNRILAAFATFLVPYIVTTGNKLIYVIADTSGNVVRDVTAIALTRVFGYQRRRKPGRGI
jgi:hypothetical protein